MTDIRKLIAELPVYSGLKPEEIVAALNEQISIPPPPPAPTTYTVAEDKGIGKVALIDVLKAQKIALSEGSKI